VSHLKEREEKICLNCNAAIYGRFCHVCGQENIEPRENFWYLSSHFIADLFHFDGKFFSTLKKLLFKPGYLAHEHLRGKRAEYLHPIRLYIFVSAFFFLIVFAFYTKKHNTNEVKKEKSYVELMDEFNKFKQEKQADLLEKKGGYKSSFTTTIEKDSLDIIDTDSAINLLNADTTNKETAELIFSVGIKNWQSGYWEKHRTKETYLDSQSKLPPQKRHGYFQRKQELVEIAIDEKAKEEHLSRNQALVDILLHNLPKGLFIGLPVYAFILFIIYSRNKRLCKPRYFFHTFILLYVYNDFG